MGIPYVEHTNPTPVPSATAPNTNNAAAGANRKFVIMASSVVVAGPRRATQIVALALMLILISTLFVMAITVYTLTARSTMYPWQPDPPETPHPASNPTSPSSLLRSTLFSTLRPNFEKHTEQQEDDEDSTPLSSPYLRILSRKEWQAEPPSEKIAKMDTPVPYVIIMHTATANCSSQVECSFHARTIQMYQQESIGWWDIGYNFLVGGDGSAYEGRGWTKIGFHTYGYNYKSIGIAFIGTFDENKPPKQQLTACERLIEEGVELGYISKNYTLLGARQLESTSSPGNELFKEIKTWSHWRAAA